MEMVVLQYKERSQQEHRRILEACQQRNQSAAIELLTRHIEDAGKLLVEFLQQQTNQDLDSET